LARFGWTTCGPTATSTPWRPPGAPGSGPPHRREARLGARWSAGSGWSRRSSSPRTARAAKARVSRYPDESMGGTITRRQFLLGVGAAFVASACSGGGSKPNPQRSGSLGALRQGATELSVLSSESPVNPGKNYFGFGLVTNTGEVVSGGSPRVWLAKDFTAAAPGPFLATRLPFATASDSNDAAPRT